MAAAAQVSVLLDTCAILAIARGELPDGATESLRVAPDAYVSVVSAWEVAIKAQTGKLRLSQPPYSWFVGMLERYNLREIQLEALTVCSAAALPPVHRDPFDRVIVALAQAHTLTVLTSDRNIPKYAGVRTLW